MSALASALEGRRTAWAATRDAVRRLAIWFAMLGAIGAGLVIDRNLVEPGQLSVIGRQAAPLGVLAIGQTLVILGRGFDLSVGGVVAFVNVLAANLFGGDGATVPVVVICLAVGFLVGTINGAGIVYGGISPLVMTLGMAFVLSGALLIYTDGAPTGSVPLAIRNLSSAKVAGIPASVIIWLTLALVVGLGLAFSRAGRYLYAVGANPTTARLSGVPVRRVECGSYILSGFCAALGGLLLAGYVGRGSLGAGEDLMLQSLAAVVIGGTTFEGGKGGVSGSVGGAYFLALVGALLTGVGAAKAGNLITQGIVLVIAAALYRSVRR